MATRPAEFNNSGRLFVISAANNQPHTLVTGEQRPPPSRPTSASRRKKNMMMQEWTGRLDAALPQECQAKFTGRRRSSPTSKSSDTRPRFKKPWKPSAPYILARHQAPPPGCDVTPPFLIGLASKQLVHEPPSPATLIHFSLEYFEEAIMENTEVATRSTPLPAGGSP